VSLFFAIFSIFLVSRYKMFLLRCVALSYICVPTSGMRPVRPEVVGFFRTAIRGVLKSVGVVDFVPQIALVEANPRFGDYQCNNAMGLFKDYKTQLAARSPKDVADKIVAALNLIRPNVNEEEMVNEIAAESGSAAGGSGHPIMFSNVVVAPQGFITVVLATEWIIEFGLAPLDRAGEARFIDPHPKKVVVDFSSPNIAKEMHVGHLRSTILGETVSRILEDVGHSVTRYNHVGDWGTQFGMLIEYIKELYPDFLTERPIVSDLEKFYKAAKKRFDEDEDFKTRARARVVTLQSGDAFSLAAWGVLCDISRAEFDKIYRRLGITLTEKGESFYNSMLPMVIEMLNDKRMITDSDGAQCIFTGVDDIPLMAVKSDGGYGYDSTDLAAVYNRLIEMQSDWVVYFTDIGQASHFYKIFEAAEKAGWHTPPTTRLDHAGFGLVVGEDGKRFRTRSTETVKLMDLLDEATARAEITIREKLAKSEDTSRSEEWIKETAEALGMASVRYFDMRSSRTTNYKFDYDQMLDPHGNTAVYSMYAYARICSILRKVEAEVDVSTLSTADLHVAHPTERALALSLIQFPDMITDILSDVFPHRLTGYTFELSNKFTSFYSECKVAGTPEMRSRLVLLKLTKLVMHKCLTLLGITPLESM
jgi:arginyl-tRNA synthetase